LRTPATHCSNGNSRAANSRDAGTHRLQVLGVWSARRLLCVVLQNSFTQILSYILPVDAAWGDCKPDVDNFEAAPGTHLTGTACLRLTSAGRCAPPVVSPRVTGAHQQHSAACLATYLGGNLLLCWRLRWPLAHLKVTCVTHRQNLAAPAGAAIHITVDKEIVRIITSSVWIVYNLTLNKQNQIIHKMLILLLRIITI
jgi:hypothetical protein